MIRFTYNSYDMEKSDFMITYTYHSFEISFPFSSHPLPVVYPISFPSLLPSLTFKIYLFERHSYGEREIFLHWLTPQLTTMVGLDQTNCIQVCHMVTGPQVLGHLYL